MRVEFGSGRVAPAPSVVVMNRFQPHCKMDGTGIQYEALPIDVRTVIDGLCSQFETECKSGGNPRIEAFLQQLDPPYRSSLFRELIVLDLHYRKHNARDIQSEYARRFTQYGDIIASVFEAHRAGVNASQDVESTCGPARGTEVAADGVPCEAMGEGADSGDGQGVPPSLRMMGRYRIVRVIGQGTFGTVYDAYDSRLNRRVAIKIPRGTAQNSLIGKQADLVEARILASLDHHGIVPVYDVQKTEDGRYYVVSKLIEGRDLRRTVNEDHPTFDRSVEIIAAAAEALHHAHGQGLVHRDVKPANILIDNSGKPYVADFGLALHETELADRPGVAGTPLYMSPEQARGENHLVSPRSDVFSLGVVLYQLLTRQLPFTGGDPRCVLAAIADGDIVPPRQHNDRIPRELERICLKAMAVRAADRYASAAELADELRSYQATRQQTTGKESRDATVIPRGLQSYDQDDADFFVRLLPGPYDGQGLPPAVRLLKMKLDDLDSEKTFRVGIVYGPSGCGKSSLIKAGVLPRLAESVLSVYLEATPARTELDLLAALHRRLPQTAVHLELCPLLDAVRRQRLLSAGQKLLIVIDQFEQWLHMRNRDESAGLVRALRQCDGGRVQCVLLVRDDFWMAARRFMSDLDEPIMEQHNAIAVDRFDSEHAGAVLTALGRAFGKLPQHPAELTRAQRAFVKEAVAALSDSRRVIPIQLAIFAEMMKHRDWNPSTLRRMGGVEGVGVALLDETFVSPTAPREYRLHGNAARAVLERLLPAAGQAIKGHSVPHAELLQVSGYANRRVEFDRLLQILTRETKLLSPSQGDTERPEGEAGSSNDVTPAYQLTHDYLVPSIREWLHRDRRNSVKGRAQLRLIERCDLWRSSRKQRKQLPSLFEWIDIELLTRHARWTEMQRDMMRRSRTVHLARVSVGLLLLVLTAAAIQQFSGAARARSLVDALKTAETTDVPKLLERLDDHHTWAEPGLRQMLDGSSSPKERLHAGLALLSADPSRRDEAVSLLLDPALVDLTAFLAVRDWLAGDPARLSGSLPSPGDTARSPQERFRMACLRPDGDDWTADTRAVVAGELTALCQQHPRRAADLIDLFRDARLAIGPELEQLYDGESPSATSVAAILASYHADSSTKLLDLLLKARPEQLPILLEPLRTRHADSAREALIEQLRARDNPLAPRPSANALVTLFQLGVTDPLWGSLQHTADPSVRSHVINTLGHADIDPTPLLDRLRQETDGGIISAILLSLGGYSPRSATFHRTRLSAAETVRRCASRVDDPGVHGAAEWLMRTWGYDVDRAANDVLASAGRRRGDCWFVSPTGHALAVFGHASDGDLDGGRGPFATPANRAVPPHRFAIGIYEITNAQFEAYSGLRPPDPLDCADAECPAARVSWYQAAAFCNWLSERENLQPCYKTVRSEPLELAPEVDCLARTGYRLPTVEEWEYACAAGSTTRWFFGATDELYGQYAWYSENTGDLKKRHVGRKMPNAFGLFDMYGNAAEWCYDVVSEENGYRALRGGAAGDPVRAWTRMREAGPPDESVPAVGFRIARTAGDAP